MYINNLNKEEKKKNKPKMWSHQIDFKFAPKSGPACSNQTSSSHLKEWNMKTAPVLVCGRVLCITWMTPYHFGFINHEENYWFVLPPVHLCHLSCMLSLCAWQEISEKWVVASCQVFSGKQSRKCVHTHTFSTQSTERKMTPRRG